MTSAREYCTPNDPILKTVRVLPPMESPPTQATECEIAGIHVRRNLCVIFL